MLNSITIYSGGSIVLSMVISIKLLFTNREKSNIEYSKYEAVNAVTVFFGTAALAGVAGIAVTWNSGVQNAVAIGYGSTEYGFL